MRLRGASRRVGRHCIFAKFRENTWYFGSAIVAFLKVPKGFAEKCTFEKTLVCFFDHCFCCVTCE